MQGLLIDISRNEDNTILFVTHDVSEAVYLADTVFVLSKRPAQVLNRIEMPTLRTSAICRSSRSRSSAMCEKQLLDLLYKKAMSSDDKPRPPYARYAFKNPYNYAVMGGFASAALLTGNWWLGLAGAGVEALWMLFAPDSRLLRKLWFDKRHAGRSGRRAQGGARRQVQARCPSRTRCAAWRCARSRSRSTSSRRRIRRSPSICLSGELQKLDDLVRAFLELSVTCARYQDYLGSVDVDEIERDLRRYHQIVDKGEGDKRTLAQKNIAVLEKRKDKYAEIRGYLSSARGQLELIENTFRLLADQIVTMRSPTELSGQLDELLDGVEAVRQTTRETDKLLAGRRALTQRARRLIVFRT